MSNDEFVQLRTVETIVYITTARLSITLFSVISKWDDVESSPYLECLVTTIRLHPGATSCMPRRVLVVLKEAYSKKLRSYNDKDDS